MAGSSVIGSLLVTLGADTAAFETGLKGAQGKLAGFGKVMGSLGSAAFMAVGAAAAAGGAALVKFGFDSLESADNIGDAAARIGTSAEAYQKLGIAATAAGGTPELMTEAMDKLNAKLGAFQMSGGKTGGAFKELGLSSKIMSGEIKTADEAFYAAADALQNVTNPAEKAKLSMELFGKSAGVGMVEVTAQGGAALRKFGDDAAASGRVMSTDMVAKLSDAKLAIDNAKTAASQMATVFGGQVVIGISDFAKSMKPAFDQMQQVGAKVMDFLKPSLDELGQVFKSLSQNQTLIAALKGLATIIGGAVVVSFKIMLEGSIALYKSIDWLFRKIGEAGKWLGDAASAFKNFGKNLIDGLVNGIKDSAERAKAAIAQVGADLKNVFKDKLGIHSPSREFHKFGLFINEGLSDGIYQGSATPLAAMDNLSLELLKRLNPTDWEDKISDGLKSIINSYKSEFQKVLEDFTDKKLVLDASLELGKIDLDTYQNLIDKITADFEKFKQDTLQMSDITASNAESLVPTFSKALEAASNDNSELKRNFAATFSDGLRAAAEGHGMDFLKRKLEDVAGNMLEKLGGKLFDLISGSLMKSDGGGWLSSAFNMIFGGARANGGNVSVGKSYLVGERGAEIFTPSTSGSIISNDNIGGGTTNVTTHLVLDGQILDTRIINISGGVATQVAGAGFGAVTKKQERAAQYAMGRK